MDGVFLIPLAPFLFVLGIIWLSNNRKLEEKRIAAGAEQSRAGSNPQSEARIEELEDRVRVLERIVTDRGYDLATKIEALRDQRPLEARLETTELREKI